MANVRNGSEYTVLLSVPSRLSSRQDRSRTGSRRLVIAIIIITFLCLDLIVLSVYQSRSVISTAHPGVKAGETIIQNVTRDSPDKTMEDSVVLSITNPGVKAAGTIIQDVMRDPFDQVLRMGGSDVFSKAFTKTQSTPSQPTTHQHSVTTVALRDSSTMTSFDSIFGSHLTRPPTHHMIIYLLHLHKAGGTTMCMLARQNGLSTHPWNCNVQKDWRCCGNGDDYAAQADFARNTRFQFVANEKYMYTAMDTENYKYIVVLRNSIDRYASHWRHANADLKRKVTFSNWIQHQPDNWNLRHICGTRCMNIAQFNLTIDDFVYTLERLRRFHSVIFLEDFEHSFNRFAHRVGWNTYLSTHRKPHAHTVSSLYNYDRRMTILDDVLYKNAQYMYDNNGDVDQLSNYQSAFDMYTVNQTMNACTNPCCGVCSKY